jgi:hypothetical protein
MSLLRDNDVFHLDPLAMQPFRAHNRPLGRVAPCWWSSSRFLSVGPRCDSGFSHSIVSTILQILRFLYFPTPYRVTCSYYQDEQVRKPLEPVRIFSCFGTAFALLGPHSSSTRDKARGNAQKMAHIVRNAMFMRAILPREVFLSYHSGVRQASVGRNLDT